MWALGCIHAEHVGGRQNKPGAGGFLVLLACVRVLHCGPA